MTGREGSQGAEAGVPGRVGVADTGFVLAGGALNRVGEHLPERARRVAVLHTGTVAAYAETVARACRAAGREVVLHTVSDGEVGKRVPEAERAWAVLARVGLTRDDAVVAVGGGALTDAAGFVAATWLRGVAWLAVPTTTLGMVDAAHGGKVALNTVAGKNLVGAFHEPVAVVADPLTLATLPGRDIRAGLVESLKCAWLAGEGLPDGDLDGESARTGLIGRGARFKRRLVAGDLHEHGQRILLNYGHTLGHAVEAASGYGLRHGEAVAVGMVAAAELAVLLGLADAGLPGRHRSALTSLGVPVTSTLPMTDLAPYLRQDKKRGSSGQRWVLLGREGDPRVIGDVPYGAAEEAWARVLA